MRTEADKRNQQRLDDALAAFETRYGSRVTVERLRPLDRRIIARWIDRPEKTAGGIVLPETARGVSQTGVAVRVAQDCRDVKVGDTIIFSQYGGDEFRPALPLVALNFDVDDLVVVREQDVYCVVEP